MAFDEGVVRVRARTLLHKMNAVDDLDSATIDAIVDVTVDVAAESYGDGISDQQDATRP